MTRTDKIEQLHNLLLTSTDDLTIEYLENLLDCSRSTVYRLFNNLKKIKGRNVVIDNETQSYKYSSLSSNIIKSLTHQELSNLLLIRHLLNKIDEHRLQQIFGDNDLMTNLDAILLRRYPSDERRKPLVKFIPDIVRQVNDKVLPNLVNAINDKLMLDMKYHSHGKDETTERTISPQQIVYYRHNWYLDGWCFKRNDWRIFALDGII